MTVASTAPDDESTAPGIQRIESKHPRRVPRSILVAGAVLLLLVAALWCIGVFGGNVHAIVPGRAYRSATLTGLSYTGVSARLAGNDLDSVLRRDHIATVICLRGGSPANDWYREEIEVCNREHAVHEDVPISARSLPPPDAMARLLDIFDHARYPILLHCQGGSDRAGLASTIYANLYGGVPLDRAEADQLTWRYGHIPVDRTRAMDAFFDLYRRDAHGMGLREWILRRYPAAYLQAATAPAPNR